MISDLFRILLRSLAFVLFLPIKRFRLTRPGPVTYLVKKEAPEKREGSNPLRVRIIHNRFTALGVVPREEDQVLVDDDPATLDPYVQEWLQTRTDRAKVVRYKKKAWRP